MRNHEAIIAKAYESFNSRNIDSVLSLMTPDVHWPKAFEGNYVVGHEAIRAYWTRQWREINPIVTPVNITSDGSGKTIVDIRQNVKDLAGNVLFDGIVKHIYLFEDGLIARMDIG